MSKYKQLEQFFSSKNIKSAGLGQLVDVEGLGAGRIVKLVDGPTKKWLIRVRLDNGAVVKVPPGDLEFQPYNEAEARKWAEQLGGFHALGDL